MRIAIKPVAEFINQVLTLSQKHVAAPAHHQPASSTCRPDRPAPSGLPALPPVRYSSSLIVSPEIAASPPRSWPTLMASVLDPPLMSVHKMAAATPETAHKMAAAPELTDPPERPYATARTEPAHSVPPDRPEPTSLLALPESSQAAESSLDTAPLPESSQADEFPESSQARLCSPKSSQAAAVFSRVKHG
ncbi:hypothetical protein M9458_048660, partial [Cirrhinus mrigala]